MAARSSGALGPRPPRISAPDVPTDLDAVSALRSRVDLLGVLVDGVGGEVDAAHCRLVESRVDAASGPAAGRVDATGATFVDVAVDQLRAMALVARDGSWRNVELTGGRIATLDGLRVRWDSVVVRGAHIDYLSLPSAELTDVLFVDCSFGSIDLPEARLARVAFEGCRADEVDTRGMRGDDVDLRGLEALAFTDVRALTGAWLQPRQAELHAPAFAQALGIRIVA